MKNKLFLVALATVTVLGPSLATPHHQTVHAAERCTHVSDNPNVFLCSDDGKPTIQTNSVPNPTQNQKSGPLDWIWNTIKGWWEQVKNWFS